MGLCRDRHKRTTQVFNALVDVKVVNLAVRQIDKDSIVVNLLNVHIGYLVSSAFMATSLSVEFAKRTFRVSRGIFRFRVIRIPFQNLLKEELILLYYITEFDKIQQKMHFFSDLFK